MDKSTKIICYKGDRAACWYYRIHLPMIHLARHNKEKYNITIAGAIGKDHIGKYNLAILQRQYKFEVLEPILEMKRTGTKLIYEIDDDLFHVPEWNPAHEILGARKTQDGIKHFLSQVNAMFVTTEALKKAYEDYCEHIYVLPNSLDYSFLFPSEDYNTKLPVVCWQGSMTHERDVAIAQKGFEQLAQDKDLIFKMWCGFDRETKNPIFDIPGAQTLPLVPFEGFFQMFGQVGVYIGVAPLAANQFNKGKSNLKFLEYTAYNAVTVASNFGPYKDTIEDGITGILVSDNRDWYDKVREVLDDSDLYMSILNNAKQFVTENYDINKNYTYWQTAIEEVIGG